MKTGTSNQITLETYKRSKAPVFAAIERSAVQGMAPIALDPSLNSQSVLDELNAAIDAEKVEVRQHFHPKVNDIQGRLDELQLKEAKKILNGKLEQLKRQMRAADIDLSQVNITYNWQTVKPRIAGVLIILAADILLNYRSIQAVAQNKLTALAASVVVMLALAFSAHLIARGVQRASSPQLKRKRFWLGLAGGAVFFFVLGLARASFYGSDNSLLASPLLWMVWNSFFFAMAILLAGTLPTKEQEEEHSRYVQLKKKRDELSADQAAVEWGLEEVNDAYAELVKRKAVLEESQRDIEAYIEAQRRLAITRAVKEYHLRGGDFTPAAAYSHSPTNQSLP